MILHFRDYEVAVSSIILTLNSQLLPVLLSSVSPFLHEGGCRVPPTELSRSFWLLLFSTIAEELWLPRKVFSRISKSPLHILKGYVNCVVFTVNLPSHILTQTIVF